MDLTQWARKWGIRPEAMADLHLSVTHTPDLTGPTAGTSEEARQNLVRLEAAEKNCILWRNNVGALKDERGVPVRYGLANDTAEVNRNLKSSDLIGIRRVLIEPWHVGLVMGQFVAREMKAAGWQYKATPRERAQLAYLNLVLAYGGDAAFATGEGSL